MHLAMNMSSIATRMVIENSDLDDETKEMAIQMMRWQMESMKQAAAGMGMPDFGMDDDYYHHDGDHYYGHDTGYGQWQPIEFETA